MLFFLLSGRLRQNWYYFLLKTLVGFTNEVIWAWNPASRNVISYKRNGINDNFSVSFCSWWISWNFFISSNAAKWLAWCYSMPFPCYLLLSVLSISRFCCLGYLPDNPIIRLIRLIDFFLLFFHFGFQSFLIKCLSFPIFCWGCASLMLSIYFLIFFKREAEK